MPDWQLRTRAVVWVLGLAFLFAVFTLSTLKPVRHKVERAYTEDVSSGDLLVTVTIANPGVREIAVGGLGLSLATDQIFSQRDLADVARECSFADPYMGASAGYVQMVSTTGTGPVLLLAIDAEASSPCPSSGLKPGTRTTVFTDWHSSRHTSSHHSCLRVSRFGSVSSAPTRSNPTRCDLRGILLGRSALTRLRGHRVESRELPLERTHSVRPSSGPALSCGFPPGSRAVDTRSQCCAWPCRLAGGHKRAGLHHHTGASR